MQVDQMASSAIAPQSPGHLPQATAVDEHSSIPHYPYPSNESLVDADPSNGIRADASSIPGNAQLPPADDSNRSALAPPVHLTVALLHIDGRKGSMAASIGMKVLEKLSPAPSPVASSGTPTSPHSSVAHPMQRLPSAVGVFGGRSPVASLKSAASDDYDGTCGVCLDVGVFLSIINCRHIICGERGRHICQWS